MLIYRKLNGTWDKASRRYQFSPKAEKLLYRGSVAEAKSGGGDNQSTQTVVATGPWQQQIPYVNMLMDQAMRLYQGGAPQYPDMPLTPDVNATIQASQGGANRAVTSNAQVNQNAQQGLMQTANGSGSNPVLQTGQNLQPQMQQGIGNLITGGNAVLDAGNATNPALTGTLNSTMGGGNPYQQVNAPGVNYGQTDLSGAISQALNGNGMNPHTDAIVNAALRSSNDQFSQNILPQIRTAAGGANQIGGTRQGIAEGVAAKGLQQQQGDIISRLYGQAFDTASADRNNAMGLVAQGQNINANTNLTAQGMNLQAQQAARNQALQAAGISQGLLTAGTDLSQQAQSTGTAQAGNLLTTGNNQAMDQYFRSLGLIPQFQAADLAGRGFQNQLGLQQYGLDQAAIDANLDKAFYNQLSPYNALSQFQSYISGAYGSSLPGTTPQTGFPQGYRSSTPSPQGYSMPPNADVWQGLIPQNNIYGQKYGMYQ